MREAERNEELRRADWRFLLGLTEAPTSICFGPERLAQVVEWISSPLPSSARAEGVDLAVIGDVKPQSLAKARGALRPGGSLYVETARPHFTRSRVERRLAAAGFLDVRLYLPWPWPSRAPRVWLPLDRPGEDLFSGLGPPRSWRQAVARALWRVATRFRVVIPLRVVARKPGRVEASEIDGLVRAKWREWGFGAPPERLTWLLLTGGRRSINKVVALVRGDSDTEPRLVVKLPRSESEEEALRREYETLRAVALARPSLEGVPRPLFVGRRCGRLCIGETFLEGTTLIDRLDATTHAELAAGVTDWLAELGGATATTPRSGLLEAIIEDPLHDFEQTFDTVVSRGELARTRKALSLLGDLPLVREHRDCAPWNILVDESGRLGFLDWESSVAAGLPALDLVYFLTYAALVVENAFALPQAQEAYARMRDASTGTGTVNLNCEQAYLQRLGLERDVLVPLRLLCWIIHSRSEYRRLKQDVGRVPDAAALRGSLFLALWQQELRHAP